MFYTRDNEGNHVPQPLTWVLISLLFFTVAVTATHQITDTVAATALATVIVVSVVLFRSAGGPTQLRASRRRRVTSR